MSSFDEKEAVGEILRGFAQKPIIVELGAHVGEEAEWIIPLCVRPKYVMVEPDEANIEKIVRRKLEADISVIHGAVGSSLAFDFPFYYSENLASNNRASGSIRKPTGHLKHFPEVTFTPTTVCLWTLDAIAAAEQIKRVDMLWCDIQGAERDMVEGGRATLAKTRYMMIEAEPEVELYEGQALKPELIAMLPGWEVLRDFGYNLLMRNTKCER